MISPWAQLKGQVSWNRPGSPLGRHSGCGQAPLQQQTVPPGCCSCLPHGVPFGAVAQAPFSRVPHVPLAAHAPPPVPQAPSWSPAWHAPPAQQPAQLPPPRQTHAPPSQSRSSAAQATHCPPPPVGARSAGAAVLPALGVGRRRDAGRPRAAAVRTTRPRARATPAAAVLAGQAADAVAVGPPVAARLAATLLLALLLAAGGGAAVRPLRADLPRRPAGRRPGCSRGPAEQGGARLGQQRPQHRPAARAQRNGDVPPSCGCPRDGGSGGQARPGCQ